MLWNQVYDPVGDPVLLTILAAVPIAVLLLGNLQKISAEQLGITPMLACLMGGFVMPQAYVPPFTALVIGGH